MLNYLKKFAVDIFPSVAATVIGAYIVNHYIVAKPADAPAAAAVSAANPKGDGKAEANAAEDKADAKSGESSANVSNLPAAGVKARGISEKAIMEKNAAERSAVAEKIQKADEKAEIKADAKPDANKADTNKPDTNKSEVKSAESPADVDRRHAAAPREKEKIRVVLPSPIQPVNTPAAPVAAAAPAAPPAPAVPVETAAAPEERRDANDLARAAIERLRANGETSPRVAEPARAPEAPKVANAPTTTNAPALRPLPPPIMISGSPAGEPFGQTRSQARPPYAEANDPNRPVPPADIPTSRPLDLRAEMAEPSVRERATAAAEDALSTAKSIFHAVLPK
ncbi:hypothetical protein J6524_24865 [Bradyrhizobium sp. WSM 1738]|uniref:hypothetical protein n=1 Tax=Bradyrhizobium hereditatis TaxID=2821405 RepID=UPI001CE39C5E|nr:hypothetical protein [Bradyrhizobium hereditatis]MCA6118084.1 hypothetical protein [Bradyrhizobium hereditatis]